MKTTLHINFNNAEGRGKLPASTLRFDHHEQVEVHSGDMLVILRMLLRVMEEDSANAGATIIHTVEA